MIRGLTAICLLLLLTACASAPPPIIRTKTEYRYAPPLLMAPCTLPVFTGQKNRDLADYALLLQTIIIVCNSDKAAIRDWSHQ